MKKLFLILLFLFVVLDGFSQIINAEYFIDTDPGVGNGTALVMTGNIIDQNYSVPTTGLTDGIHKLHIRVQYTDGTWSMYDNNVFFINPNQSNSALITAAEYFFDTDPGVGNGTALAMTGNIIDQNYSVSTTGLTDGIHKLYVRTISADGTWSLYDKNMFYIRPNQSNTSLITAAEYFIDIDPGIGNATYIELANTINLDVDLVVDIPTDLADGDHFLYIRVLNTAGEWSLYAPSETLTTLSTPDFGLNSFKFYPNPVKDILYFNTNDQNITDFKVIDLNGRIILKDIPFNNQIDISNLNSGTYLFQLRTEKGSISKKIIKE